MNHFHDLEEEHHSITESLENHFLGKAKGKPGLLKKLKKTGKVSSDK